MVAYELSSKFKKNILVKSQKKNLNLNLKTTIPIIIEPLKKIVIVTIGRNNN